MSQNYGFATLPSLLKKCTLAAWQFQRYAPATLLIVIKVGGVHRA